MEGKCPQCGGQGIEIDSRLEDYIDPQGKWGEPIEVILYQCDACGYVFDSEHEARG